MFEERFLMPRATNFQALTPLSLLRRALEVRAEKPAVIWRDLERTYADFGILVRRMAHWLKSQGIGKGDVVSLLLGNRPEMLAAHFAVPAMGAVLNTINTRLNTEEVEYILGHPESRLLIGDVTTLGSIGDKQALDAFCRARLSAFKRPKKFVFGPLPKTATGKVQKFALRLRAKEMVDAK